jgi:putative endonuclease
MMSRPTARSHNRSRRGVQPAKRTQLGREFELQIRSKVEALGWTVLAQNVRFGRDEVDLLAFDSLTLVIIEVRGRSNETTDAVLLQTSQNARKLKALKRVAEKVLHAYPNAEALRVDLAVVGTDGVDLLQNAVDFSLL